MCERPCRLPCGPERLEVAVIHPEERRVRVRVARKGYGLADRRHVAARHAGRPRRPDGGGFPWPEQRRCRRVVHRQHHAPQVVIEGQAPGPRQVADELVGRKRKRLDADSGHRREGLGEDAAPVEHGLGPIPDRLPLEPPRHQAHHAFGTEDDGSSDYGLGEGLHRRDCLDASRVNGVLRNPCESPVPDRKGVTDTIRGRLDVPPEQQADVSTHVREQIIGDSRQGASCSIRFLVMPGVAAKDLA